MTPQDVYNYYGTGYRFSKATGLAQSNLTYWFKRGYVPVNSQARLHRMTKGALRIELDLTIVDEIEDDRSD